MGEFQLYKYTPTMAGAIIYGVTFIILLGYNIFIICQSLSKVNLHTGGLRSYNKKDESLLSLSQNQVSCFKKQILPMFIPMMIGILMEAVGYFARASSHGNKQLLTPYIIQSILLLIAPSFIAATIYMIFGRMMRHLNASDYSIIKFKYQTTFFVIGDVFSFFVQSAGGGMMSQSGNQDLGPKIVIAGLIIQLIFLFFFILSEIKFTYLINKIPTTASYGSTKTSTMGIFQRNWNNLNATLIITSILIVVRCIVRVVEFGQGFDGFIISHEAFIYLLDGLLMIMVSSLLICVRPESVMLELMNHE
ncbi:hypothetical protein DASC09_017230 [Saccharomycopsis crataegensis]|uniref:Uncharacterized protein n=1 Tax=Saccharomycopsis crataegensis TaxID=43959 RepID=A0AAV5QHS7_9ASCO|nr:hypothetical protein DASC09_017230 [Saccharomycopsis crataegensis]